VASATRKRQPFKIHVVRYADDSIITGTTKAILQHQVRPAIEAFLKERCFDLSNQKTHVTHISQGLDFLGQNVRKYAGKLLITSAPESERVLLEKVRELRTASRQRRRLARY
jgi:RNA-directed DNA polymerase